MSDRRAELLKLSRVLELEPDVLAQLALDAPELRSVREALSASLFDASRPALQRVASASKLLPNGTVARVGEQIFGPLLCARIVGLLAPERAVDLSLRMPDEFLADTSAQLDPRQARELVSALPVERVVSVAAILVERNDFVTLARFVDYLPSGTIQAVIDNTRDELALLHIATFVDEPARLTELVALIPNDRLREMIVAVGAHGGELWLEALAVANQLDHRWQRTLGDLTAELDTQALEAMVSTARQFAAWRIVLPLVAAMSEWAQRRFLELTAVDDDTVVGGLLDAADRLAMWPALLPLATRMPANLRQRFTRLVAQLPDDTIDRIVVAARDSSARLGLPELGLL